MKAIKFKNAKIETAFFAALTEANGKLTQGSLSEKEIETSLALALSEKGILKMHLDDGIRIAVMPEMPKVAKSYKYSRTYICVEFSFKSGKIASYTIKRYGIGTSGRASIYRVFATLEKKQQLAKNYLSDIFTI